MTSTTNTPNSPHLTPSSSSALHLLAATAPTSSTTAVVSYKWRSLLKIVQLRGRTLLFFNRTPRPDLLNATHAIPLTPRNIAYHPSATTVAITGIPFHFQFGSAATALRFQQSITRSSSPSTTPNSTTPPSSPSSSSSSSSRRYRAMHCKKVPKHDAFFSPSDLRAVVDERIALQLASGSNSPFLPHLHRAFQTPVAFHLVTDTPELGDVAHLLTRLPKHRLPEPVARLLFAEAVLALSDAHALGLLLRDVTPAKLGLTDTGHVQLHDLAHAKLVVTPNSDASATGENDKEQAATEDMFSVSTMSDASSAIESEEDENDRTTDNDSDGTDDGVMNRFARTTSFIGTRSYMAPEQLSSAVDGYGTPADIWALGVTLYTMVTGRHPFLSARTQSLASLQDRVNRGGLRFPKAVSPEFRTLIEGMLEKDAAKRFSVDDVKQSAWLRDVSWAQVRLDAEEDTHVEAVLAVAKQAAVEDNDVRTEKENASEEEENEERDGEEEYFPSSSETKRLSFESCSSLSSSSTSSPPRSPPPSPGSPSFSSRRQRKRRNSRPRSRSSFNSLSLPTKQDIQRKIGEVCPWTKYKVSAHTTFAYRRISSVNNVELLGFDYNDESIKSQ